jgi:hypothetical protein
MQAPQASKDTWKEEEQEHEEEEGAMCCAWGYCLAPQRRNAPTKPTRPAKQKQRHELATCLPNSACNRRLQMFDLSRATHGDRQNTAPIAIDIKLFWRQLQKLPPRGLQKMQRRAAAGMSAHAT